jgi:glutathione S-transferase
MTASVLGIDLNLKFLDLFKGEQNTPEFLKVCFFTQQPAF